KYILHDWDDDRSIAILRTCRRAVPQNGRLLVVESLVSSGNAASFARSQDINMLINMGGRERTEAEYRAALETIASEADALEALTRDLLTVARADANGAAVPFAPIDLSAVARDAVQRLAVLAAERSVRVTVDAAANATVLAERDGLARAVVTVLHNALKYAAGGGTVEVRVARDGDLVELRVSDDGRGFSEEGLRRAFDRFWRDDETRALPGSGLGLAIAKTAAERFGGTIAIANGAGGGAVVRLRFPAQPR
ncbi:MAG: ATP-binding protein, partial [Candidatus Eremiobacteraeota bacterium]|nr:ATP-binding protein [Candidatus Eremiobacteraeota bacterium]